MDLVCGAIWLINEIKKSLMNSSTVDKITENKFVKDITSNTANETDENIVPNTVHKPVEKIKIKRFKMSELKDTPTILIIGRRRTGITAPAEDALYYSKSKKLNLLNK